MVNSKFENEKFILNYQYDKNLGRFEKIEYVDKDINDLEKKILTEACILCVKCSIQELYEHLMIRIENKLRNFKNTSYKGIIFSENISEEYKYFKKFFREFLKPFLQKDLNTSINFQAIKPNKDWSHLSSDKKKNLIYDLLNKCDFLNKELSKGIKVMRIVDNTDIYIELPEIKDINSKNKLCLDLEIYLKKNLDESLVIYLETATDKNKIRRLSL